MTTGPLPRGALSAVRDVVTVGDLGALISRRVGTAVPHDGYLLFGLDPVTGAECLHTKSHGYRTMAVRRLERADALGAEPYPFARAFGGRRRVAVLSAGSAEQPGSARLREITAEGIGSEMRVGLTGDGLIWGGLVLLRKQGSRSFTAVEAARMERFIEPLGATLRQFVASQPLRPASRILPLGVVIIGADDTVKTATNAGREWLSALAPCYAPDDERLASTLWNITYLARYAPQRALSRLPTSRGWFTVQAQSLDGHADGEVAVTLQPACGAMLLPAAAAWYGLTSREVTVMYRVIEGLATKQIARRLNLSPHTVNDHFKAIYRKTGVVSRDELLTGILG